MTLRQKYVIMNIQYFKGPKQIFKGSDILSTVNSLNISKIK